jgi:hypothetical protein
MIQKWFSRKEKEKSDDEDATKNPHKWRRRFSVDFLIF